MYINGVYSALSSSIVLTFSLKKLIALGKVDRKRPPDVKISINYYCFKKKD